MTARRSSAKGLLRVLRTEDSGFQGAFEKLAHRREASNDAIERSVRRIAERVPSSMPSR
jgi:hypothetical protein